MEGLRAAASRGSCCDRRAAQTFRFPFPTGGRQQRLSWRLHMEASCRRPRSNISRLWPKSDGSGRRSKRSAFTVYAGTARLLLGRCLLLSVAEPTLHGADHRLAVDNTRLTCGFLCACHTVQKYCMNFCCAQPDSRRPPWPSPYR